MANTGAGCRFESARRWSAGPVGGCSWPIGGALRRSAETGRGRIVMACGTARRWLLGRRGGRRAQVRDAGKGASEPPSGPPGLRSSASAMATRRKPGRCAASTCCPTCRRPGASTVPSGRLPTTATASSASAFHPLAAGRRPAVRPARDVDRRGAAGEPAAPFDLNRKVGRTKRAKPGPQTGRR
jgi:hypothetical protein